MNILEETVKQVIDGDDDIKSVFLDDKEGIVIGAENDSEIEKLIDRLPCVDELDGDTNIEKLEESLLLDDDQYDDEEDEFDANDSGMIESINSPLGLLTESAMSESMKLLYFDKSTKEIRVLLKEGKKLEKQSDFKGAKKKYSDALPKIDKVISEAKKIKDDGVFDKILHTLSFGSLLDLAGSKRSEVIKAYGADPSKVNKKAYNREEAIAFLNMQKKNIKDKITELKG